MPKKFSHQKRPYRATVILWDGTNTDEIRTVLDTVSTWGDTQLMVRWRDPVTGRQGIETLDIGDAVVTGENDRGCANRPRSQCSSSPRGEVKFFIALGR